MINNNISNEFLELQKKQLIRLSDRLGYEVQFSKEFLHKNKIDREFERKWMSSVNSLCNNGAFLIRLLLNSIDSFKHLNEDQLEYYIGKISIQPFLYIINSFEQIIFIMLRIIQNFEQEQIVNTE